MDELPPAIARVRYFRRYGRDAYVDWLISELGINAQDIPYSTRAKIDSFAKSLLNPPAWVEAAQEVMSKTPEEVDAEYEEKWDEAKEALSPPSDSLWQEEEEEEEEEEAIEVAGENNPFSDSEIDYNSWTVVELRAECKERGLPVYGTKAEIVLRLRRDDDTVTPQPEEDETEAPSEEAVEESSDTPSEEAVTEEVNENAADSEQGSDTEEEE
tara:strand:+ start:1915 stop:2553 length:639 start_codon:yes stop_codon:yes gene_type:complete